MTRAFTRFPQTLQSTKLIFHSCCEILLIVTVLLANIIHCCMCRSIENFCLSKVIVSQQWHRTPTTQETDGFQVKRPGDVNVRCTLLLMLDYQVRLTLDYKMYSVKCLVFFSKRTTKKCAQHLNT